MIKISLIESLQNFVMAFIGIVPLNVSLELLHAQGIVIDIQSVEVSKQSVSRSQCTEEFLRKKLMLVQARRIDHIGILL